MELSELLYVLHTLLSTFLLYVSLGQNSFIKNESVTVHDYIRRPDVTYTIETTILIAWLVHNQYLSF